MSVNHRYIPFAKKKGRETAINGQYQGTMGNNSYSGRLLWQLTLKNSHTIRKQDLL
jgi:hypothetical protein